MADGLILTEEENNYIGDIQLLMIADRPDEAFHICSKYAPDCSISSGYSGISVSLGAASSYSASERSIIGSVNRHDVLSPDPSSYRLGQTSTEYRARNQENNFEWSSESADKTRKNGTIETRQKNEINGTEDLGLDFYNELELLNGSEYYDSLDLNEEVILAETKNTSTPTKSTGNLVQQLMKNFSFL